MKKRIYIAGCGGMLGEAFYRQFKDDYDIKCTDKDVNDDWLTFLDFRDFDAYKKDVMTFNPDYLFHLGAFTDLEYCELHPDETYENNTLAVEGAVYIANELKIPLLYISTAGIFDGKKKIYDDWDMPNPLGVYARSKYMGERYVVEHAHRYLVCRAGWMMGSGPKKDKKFIKKIIDQLKGGSKELNIIENEGTPTYTQDFAKNVKLLLEKEYWGLYNMVCSGNTNRLEVTQELLKILNLENEIKINIVNHEYWKKEYFAERPDSEMLDNRKLRIRGLNIMRDWRISLREYVETYYKDDFSVVPMRSEEYAKQGLIDLCNEFPDNAIMAEIGSYAGESTSIFLKSGKIKQLFAIDPWKADYDKTDVASFSNFNLVEKLFDENVKGYNVVKMKTTFAGAFNLLPELDVIYIDGNHQYEAVKEDITFALNKIKKGGIICGHDYNDYTLDTVVKAIEELLGIPEKTFIDSSWMVIYK